jgi:3-oxoacyl-[acyl-carrier protein] reductase
VYDGPASRSQRHGGAGHVPWSRGGLAVIDLDGRVALVTGAGRSVGAGIARTLAARGAAVAVNDVDPGRADCVAGELREAGAAAVAAVFDVTDGDAVEAGVATAADVLGPVDILVNNAGVPPGMGLTRFRELAREAWAPFVDLNLYGVLHCTKAVIDGMCERGWGRVVTISSGAGQVGLGIGVSLYAAGKGGAIRFMRHLALEVARRGVTANTLALGLMDNQRDTESVAALAASVPVGRLGTAEDVGAAVAFLASDQAGWLTGQTIGLNGGSTTS